VGLTVFLPCRAGSERVPYKNTRPFAGSRLIDIKLQQLDAAQRVDRVVVSTNDPLVYERAGRYEKTTAHWRDESLCGNDTSTDDLIPHAAELIPDGDILWTHCTAPFVTAELYDAMIEAYGNCDSLMAVERLQGFYWMHGAPINYPRSTEKWPRTQTLPPVYKVTSGAFIAPAKTYRNGDRIGRDPYLFELDALAAIDIDTPQEFAWAEQLYENGLRRFAGPGHLQRVQP